MTNNTNRTHITEAAARCYRMGMTLSQAVRTIRGMDFTAWSDEDYKAARDGWTTARRIAVLGE